MADIKSERWPASIRNQWPDSSWNAWPASSESAFDAGKKIKGRKRHIVTDTLGNLVGLVIHPANVQDRDGAPGVLKSIRKKYPLLRHVFADGGYAGPKLQGRLEKIWKWTDHPNRKTLRHSRRI